MLFVAALSLSACTEVLEPNVDYGGNTFINDYSSLVEAVNNLNKTLQERFTALNTLLEKNLAEIKVAIDENTGAIKVLDQNTKQGLKDINTSIFDGFKTLSDQVNAQGNAIVYAMNDNGQLLRLEIEKNGKHMNAYKLLPLYKGRCEASRFIASVVSACLFDKHDTHARGRSGTSCRPTRRQ